MLELRCLAQADSRSSEACIVPVGQVTLIVCAVLTPFCPENVCRALESQSSWESRSMTCGAILMFFRSRTWHGLCRRTRPARRALESQSICFWIWDMVKSQKNRCRHPMVSPQNFGDTKNVEVIQWFMEVVHRKSQEHVPPRRNRAVASRPGVPCHWAPSPGRCGRQEPMPGSRS